MKGVILAGGSGSRLYPMTKVVTKQLQNVYDKPMIFYPLSTLMLCGIRNILIITTPRDLELFQELLGDGKNLGIDIEFAVQKEPKGLPEAFIIGEEWIGGEDISLILGDNLFYGDFHTFRRAVKEFETTKESAKVFAYPVMNPKEFGVVELDQDQTVKSLEEKPAHPKSSYAVPGFYLFDGSVSERAKKLKPSKRNELEIVDLIKSYIADNSLKAQVLGRGIAWLDTGTPQSCLEASQFIGAIEQRQGLKVACLEEIAYNMEFIDRPQFQNVIEALPNCPYRSYLASILEGK